jgi:hypothetical protein
MIQTQSKTKLTSIANQTVAAPAPESAIPVVYLETDQNILVTGTASDGATFCTVTINRPFLSSQRDKRAMSDTLFAAVVDGSWTCNLGVLTPGRYLLSCCCDDSNGDGDVLRLAVASPKMTPFLAIIDQTVQATDPKVTVDGSVSSSGNPVSCSLVPINANGQFSGGTIYNEMATVTGNSWTAVFHNPVTHLYQFRASANNEGTVYEPINVP